jgi:phosphorylase kinase alpha/beta subunit
MSNRNQKNRARLEFYYRQVSKIILVRQHPASGLIPASVAITGIYSLLSTAHGDYRDAWVRDNVYSILAVWGLALAYRRFAFVGVYSLQIR